VYAVTEKAYWRSTDMTEWFNMDTALIQDVLWHKACHPVTMNLKQIAAAIDAIIRERSLKPLAYARPDSLLKRRS
jgi:hypothetical protein